jgi:hypothetical protein
MNQQPDGFVLPDGADGRRRQPICGVLAVAAVSGRSFQEVWDWMAPQMGPKWKGATDHEERARALNHFGVRFGELRRCCMPLRWFVRLVARPGITYMVRTTKHVQLVRDGWVMDQSGVVPAAEHWGQRKRVTYYVVINP